MNIRVDEDNGKEMGIVNGTYPKALRFSRNEFWKNIVCLVSAPNFSIGGSRLCEKEEEIEIRGKNRKRRSIIMKIDSYEVCLYDK